MKKNWGNFSVRITISIVAGIISYFTFKDFWIGFIGTLAIFGFLGITGNEI